MSGERLRALMARGTALLGSDVAIICGANRPNSISTVGTVMKRMRSRSAWSSLPGSNRP